MLLPVKFKLRWHQELAMYKVIRLLWVTLESIYFIYYLRSSECDTMSQNMFCYCYYPTLLCFSYVVMSHYFQSTHVCWEGGAISGLMITTLTVMLLTLLQLQVVVNTCLRHDQGLEEGRSILPSQVLCSVGSILSG